MFRKEQSSRDPVNWKLLGSFENDDADDANNGAVIRVAAL